MLRCPVVKEEKKPVPTSLVGLYKRCKSILQISERLLPPSTPLFLPLFFYILKRARVRERERNSTIRITNERTNDVINLLTILKCLISVFRFTWRFCIVATTNCSGKKNIRKTHTHLTPKNKKSKKKKDTKKMKITTKSFPSTSISPFFHPKTIYG